MNYKKEKIIKTKKNKSNNQIKRKIMLNRYIKTYKN